MFSSLSLSFRAHSWETRLASVDAFKCILKEFVEIKVEDGAEATDTIKQEPELQDESGVQLGGPSGSSSDLQQQQQPPREPLLLTFEAFSLTNLLEHSSNLAAVQVYTN